MKKTAIILLAACAASTASAFQFSNATATAIDPTSPSNPTTHSTGLATDRAIDALGPAHAGDGNWIHSPVIFMEQSATIVQGQTPSLTKSTSFDTTIGTDFMLHDGVVAGMLYSNGNHSSELDVLVGNDQDTDIDSHLMNFYMSGVVEDNWIMGASFSGAKGEIDSRAGAATDRTHNYTFSASPFIAYTDVFKDEVYWSLSVLASYQHSILRSKNNIGQPNNSIDSLRLTIESKVEWDFSEKVSFNFKAGYTNFIERDVNSEATATVFAASRTLDEDWFNLGIGFTFRPDENWTMDLGLDIDVSNSDYDSYYPHLSASYAF